MAEIVDTNLLPQIELGDGLEESGNFNLGRFLHFHHLSSGSILSYKSSDCLSH
jgi:hypothetical protein